MSKSNPSPSPMPLPSRPASRRRASVFARGKQVPVFAAQVEESVDAPITYAQTVMPSNRRSAWGVSSTRSLKVPGSPSSALHTTWRSEAGAAAHASHLRPVVKPAPPRPRRFARLISSSVTARPLRQDLARLAPRALVAARSARSSLPRAIAACIASPGARWREQRHPCGGCCRRLRTAARPASSGLARPLHHFGDALRREPSDRAPVDEQRRRLVAHAGARRRVD